MHSAPSPTSIFRSLGSYWSCYHGFNGFEDSNTLLCMGHCGCQYCNALVFIPTMGRFLHHAPLRCEWRWQICCSSVKLASGTMMTLNMYVFIFIFVSSFSLMTRIEEKNHHCRIRASICVSSCPFFASHESDEYHYEQSYILPISCTDGSSYVGQLFRGTTPQFPLGSDCFVRHAKEGGWESGPAVLCEWGETWQGMWCGVSQYWAGA